jgi:hypothetical protein
VTKDEEDEWVRGEETEFATAAHGASVIGASSNFNSTDGVAERNIISAPDQRTGEEQR